MIVDDVENFSKYTNLNEKFKVVEKFLKENNLEEMKVGSYEIMGRDVYVNIDEYTTKESSVPEAHRNYIDIQIVLCGHEKIGYSSVVDGKTEIEYDANRDIEFLKADCEFLKADSSRFFIFYPQDLHQPCITDGDSSQIKKAVFKVKI
ncbi:MAG: YhcH/YjgK/YiaL family protein [Candidatus Gastranaerophilaceae bacterium]